ncbi:MAG: hypothetical protein ACYC6L_02575 [Anaerolineae bacterium]
MPARKPASLQVGNDTISEKEGRAENEAAMRSENELALRIPPQLNGLKVAQDTWRKLITEFNAIEGKWVSKLDQSLVVNYCILVEQISELDQMRAAAYRQWLNQAQIVEQVQNDTEMAMRYSGGDDKGGLVDKAIDLVRQVESLQNQVLKFDARVDRKRALAMQYMQNLYMTPRARAAVVPTVKTPAGPDDPMTQLLNSAGDLQASLGI